MPQSKKIRIAAMSDLHYSKTSAGQLAHVFLEIAEIADVLLLCGDLTDYGLPDEAQVLVKDLNAHLKIPILAVLGNHDYESGKANEVQEVLRAGDVRLLDGDCTEVAGIGFVGTRGFAGGFGSSMLTPWGESIIKDFVQEAVGEALKLEAALSRLQTSKKVVMMHYSPVRDTIVGEPEEIFPFMGCTRLEEPLNRVKVDVCFHGHAHKGQPEGRTSAGIPVYNVAVAVLRHAYPDHAPYRTYDISP